MNPYIGKKSNKSYKKIISTIQKNDLTGIQKIFSKIIHSPAAEIIAPQIANFLFRPNALLFGGFMSLSATSIAYIIAKQYGYALSGSEALLSFVFGWFFGNLYDYAKIAFKK